MTWNGNAHIWPKSNHLIYQVVGIFECEKKWKVQKILILIATLSIQIDIISDVVKMGSLMHYSTFKTFLKIIYATWTVLKNCHMTPEYFDIITGFRPTMFIFHEYYTQIERD